MSYLKVISPESLTQLTNKRDGEVKLGEALQTLSADHWQQSLKESSASFVFLGIPEDIGVRANLGVGGTHTLWEAALKAILNVQHTDSLDGSHLAVLGSFQFNDWMQKSAHMDIPQLRDTVSLIDEEVYPVISDIISLGKIPIIIGGGHNNAFPIIKGAASALGTPLNCINLDPHSDYRPMEGRHSGNGFRYAKAEGFLKKYALLGLHRNYNSQSVLNDLTTDPEIHHTFYEDIFLNENTDFNTAIDHAIRFTSGAPTGIELDLDAIEGVLSSAITPSGITALQARKYVTTTARYATPAYLHLPEGITTTSDGRHDNSTGKLIAYLVTDFIRSSLGK